MGLVNARVAQLNLSCQAGPAAAPQPHRQWAGLPHDILQAVVSHLDSQDVQVCGSLQLCGSLASLKADVESDRRPRCWLAESGGTR